MKSPKWKDLIAIIVVLIAFFAGFISGKSTGYDIGFENGASTAEEYAKECYNNLDSEVKEEFGITAYDATTAINKYDGVERGAYLFEEYSDVVNAHYALGYFYDRIWYELCDISEVALELGEIDTN